MHRPLAGTDDHGVIVAVGAQTPSRYWQDDHGVIVATRPLVHRPRPILTGEDGVVAGSQSDLQASGYMLGGYRVRLEWALSNQTTLCCTRGERLKSAVLNVRFPALLYLLRRTWWAGPSAVPTNQGWGQPHYRLLLRRRPRTSLAGAPRRGWHDCIQGQKWGYQDCPCRVRGRSYKVSSPW